MFCLHCWDLRPNVLSANDDAKCVGAIVVGGLVAVFIIPYGFVPIMSGQAFITSNVATFTYIAVSALGDR